MARRKRYEKSHNDPDEIQKELDAYEDIHSSRKEILEAAKEYENRFRKRAIDLLAQEQEYLTNPKYYSKTGIFFERRDLYRRVMLEEKEKELRTIEEKLYDLAKNERVKTLENTGSPLHKLYMDPHVIREMDGAGITKDIEKEDYYGFHKDGGEFIRMFERAIFGIDNFGTIQLRKEELEASKKHKEKEDKKYAREARAEERKEAIKQSAAAARGKSRELADQVKQDLPRDHDCPYCGNGLGENPHADHIYPIAKGGHSSHANMVYVCASCNMKKSDLTLLAFCKKFNLDRTEVWARLEKLGKDF
jgi:5-methylcytosine-specific restriction endonuclease McrA